MNPEKREMLPGNLFDGFAKKRELPTLKEGFQDITTIDFVVSNFLQPSLCQHCANL
jgi:hypothetical protein